MRGNLVLSRANWAPVPKQRKLNISLGREYVDEGMVHSEKNVYTEYADPKRSEWIPKIQPALKKPPLHVLVKACGEKLSRRELIELRAGRSKPHRKTQELLVAILKNFGLV